MFTKTMNITERFSAASVLLIVGIDIILSICKASGFFVLGSPWIINGPTLKPPCSVRRHLNKNNKCVERFTIKPKKTNPLLRVQYTLHQHRKLSNGKKLYR